MQKAGLVPSLKQEIGKIVIEALIVAVTGLGLALAANVVSPRGLVLSRNYFPAGPATPAPAQKSVPSATNAPVDDQAAEAAEVSGRLRDKGLQEVKRSQVEQLLRSPLYQDGRIIFVDARDEDHYQDGHIPGACQLNPYHPEKELGNVLPLCQAAQKVIVYCTGGECEDADTTAILLQDSGVPATNLFVYGGGFTEWEDRHLPVETGARNSGMLRSSK